MFTPNKLTHATCPHCKVLLNTLSWIPLLAVGNAHYVRVNCPVERCGKPLVVRVYVNAVVEVEPGQVASDTVD